MTDPSDDAGALDRLSADLDGVERALARLDSGDYGRCEQCGEPVDPDRLVADPTASRCVAH